MALINCPVCSKRISDQSISCPSCGFPTPTQQTDDNSRVNNRQSQKNSGCSGAAIFLLIIAILIGAWLMDGYDSHTEETGQYNEAQSELHNESQQVQESVFDSPLPQIPMLLSGSGEDGRYFLISHFTSYGIENVKYARRGNGNDSFGEMQIDCTNHKIRKTSSENLDDLISADLGDWYTPTPDWTDQDIVNFICKKQPVPKQPQLNTERTALKEPTSASETFVTIPISDSYENGRYFLTSKITENGVENIEYIRKGNNDISYAKMQIKCSENEIRIYSADNADALQSANMGDWITPTPDWTDQDIVNFICK